MNAFLMLTILRFYVIQTASRGNNGENGCVKFAEIATQTVNLTNLLTNFDPNLANCNMMSASFLDHISISALATSPPTSSAIDAHSTNREQHLSQNLTSNNNDFATINNNNLNNISNSTIADAITTNSHAIRWTANDETIRSANIITTSRRSSSDAIPTNSHAIGWIANDATVPRSNSCSSTGNSTRLNSIECNTGSALAQEDKCQLKYDPCELEAIPSIDDTNLIAPTRIDIERLVTSATVTVAAIATASASASASGNATVDECAKSDADASAAVETDTTDDGVDASSDANATSENAKTHSDGINGATSDLCS